LRLRDHIATPEGRREVQAELARALADGPGVLVFAGAFPDPGVVDRATAVFEAMIAEQKATGVVGGDHFATPGANDRVWGALDKLAVRDPEAFAAYYGNDLVALASEAWLGRGYQVTRSPARSTWSTLAAPPRSPTATITWGSCRRSRAAPSRRTCTASPPS
jgi:ectoine hydroxylase-related dioxygenase (phytanoyl-CoA dioxygenase family)